MQKIRSFVRKHPVISIFIGLAILVIIGTIIFLIILANQPKTAPEESVSEMTEITKPIETTPVQKPGPTAGLSVKMPNHYGSSNCTVAWGPLMLINPNFTVDTNFIAQRQGELINLTTQYGIREGNSGNGAPLMDKEAAEHLNEMIQAYQAENPGHTMTTRSCFRARGTTCGRLCVATGGSDHHSGYTCDLVDDAYGDTLDPDLLGQHPDWQWLYKNSYRFGFVDRFPEEWAGGPLSEPANIDANGSTGLIETWHYRYVGIDAATEIATGKYNNGRYDSLEHYLKSAGVITNLVDMTATCQN